MVAVVGLGANLGARRETLERAIDLLAVTPRVRVSAVSPVYETEPVGEVLEQRAFFNAVLRVETRLAPERLRGFGRPVYYSHGSLSHPRWAAMAERLAGVFPDFTAELYESIHHLETSHQREPARVAAALRRLWERA